MAKHLTITIPADSDVVQIDVAGFQGEACLAATEAIERAIGVVTDRTKKGEAYCKAATKGHVRQGG